MKKALLLAISGLFIVATAGAADNENSEKATTDVSKNPITGTQTTTKKYRKKVKHGKAAKGDVTVTEKTKVHKDGEVEKKVDASGSSDTQPQK